ncbi:hypothetical protein [Devosia ginsengisoli]|uniref:hypothetical protein n=1 Tax=Devosia ginsengisoli TaxID=400770 RepID=UPI0026F20E18|nr:hypothetical protein [Devosia ginsengisoli]MCR6671491.1 hypothetical protein [Devosia ginsengisoli]
MTDHALTRRALIAGTGAALAGTALAVPYVNVVQADDVSLPVDPVARYEAAVAEFRAAAEALYSDIADWTVNASDSGVIVFGYRPPKPVEFTGYGVYEIQLRKARPIVALAASESGRGYYRQLYWQDQRGNDRFQGEVKFTRPSAFTIVRKIRALA